MAALTELWWAYLAIGAGVGFLAGMLGIGGGMVQVALMVFVCSAKGYPTEHVVHMAIATAMATIPFTAAASVGAHHGRGNVDWGIVRGMLPGLLAGAALGALSTGLIPARPLAVFFTAFIFLAGTNMFFDLKPGSQRELPGRVGLLGFGAFTGVISSYLAAGAAFMTIPFMSWCSVPLKRAIGTAAALGFPLGVAGTLGYIWGGWGRPGLPEATLGYVYLPALAMIAVSSMPLAPLGARASAALPVRHLRRVFGVILYALVARMLVSLW
ncbi:MAG: sulfite exporter TauE/SafE family protein [Betaproteobacteria bacterium]|nr:sulfite exporter TauE/SafE family protein [Betaproteobacteria bacterium]